MIIQLKELTNVISQLTDLLAGEKTPSGILFNIEDNKIQVCYADKNKVFVEDVPAEIVEGDIKGKIVFNYQALTRVIEACKPTGTIKTETINFEFCDGKIIRVEAVKKIQVNRKNKETDEVITEDKVVSVVSQSLGWSEADGSPRTAMLSRSDYSLLHHLSEEYINANYEGKPLKPVTVEHWEANKDAWDIAELRAILSKLSIESGKIVYVAPTRKSAFVMNTSSVISIPLKNTIINKMVQSSSTAKAFAAMLGKVDAPDGIIYSHMIDNDTLVFSLEDNSLAVSITNAKQENSHINQVGRNTSKDYGHYMFNFNREVLQSCLYGAKTAGASDKAVISFEKSEDDGKMRLVMTAKNTNSSTDNKYDVLTEYSYVENDATDLKLNVTLEFLFQAVSKAETDFIAIDINVAENGTKTVRVGEIDMEARAKVAEDNEVSGSWTTEFTQEHRGDILGYTTYFAVGNE